MKYTPSSSQQYTEPTPDEPLSEIDALHKELEYLKSENKELKEKVVTGLGEGKANKIFEVIRYKDYSIKILSRKSSTQSLEKFNLTEMFNCTTSQNVDMDLVTPKFYYNNYNK